MVRVSLGEASVGIRAQSGTSISHRIRSCELRTFQSGVLRLSAVASMTSADTQNTGATGVAPETALLQVPRATLHAFAALLFRAPSRETYGASRAVVRTRAPGHTSKLTEVWMVLKELGPARLVEVEGFSVAPVKAHQRVACILSV